MTLGREISWILVIKLIAISAIWYVWFSGQHQEVDPLHLVIPPSSSIEQNTPSTPQKSEVSQ